MHLSGLALTAFIIHAALLSGGSHRNDLFGVDFVTGGWILVQIGLAVAVLGVFGERAVEALHKIGPALLGYGAIVAFSGCSRCSSSTPWRVMVRRRT